jgi:hypothetical protein
MLDSEIRTWARTANPETVIAIGVQASKDRDDWASRMRRDAQEMLEAMPHCTGRVTPTHCLRAAQLASIEMAVVCDIWPKPLDDVLRGDSHLALRPI